MPRARCTFLYLWSRFYMGLSSLGVASCLSLPDNPPPSTSFNSINVCLLIHGAESKPKPDIWSLESMAETSDVKTKKKKISRSQWIWHSNCKKKKKDSSRPHLFCSLDLEVRLCDLLSEWLLCIPKPGFTNREPCSVKLPSDAVLTKQWLRDQYPWRLNHLCKQEQHSLPTPKALWHNRLLDCAHNCSRG